MALAETARLIASLELKDKFSAGVTSATKSLGKLETRVGRLGSIAASGAQAAGRNIERGVAVGAVAAAGALTWAVKSAIDWESAIAGVNKTIEATPAELKAIEQGLIDLSNRMPVAAADLAMIAENAGALGIAKQDILSFTETVALIGSTTNVSVDEAATALGQLGNVLKLTGDDYDNFAAALVDLGNKGASTEAQILEIARRSGSAATLIGIAKDATLGWSAAAANLGMNEELAGTSLQNLFLKAMPAYTKGSKDLQKITGLTAAQLKKSWQKDAGGALEALVAQIGSMPKDARLAAVQKLFGKGSGLTRLVLGLAESYDRNLKPALETSTDAWKENTAATAEAEKRFKTTQSQLAILKNNVTNAAVTIGTNLLPVINEFASEAVAWISTHQDDIKNFGRDLSVGIKSAVEWARKLPWDSITAGLKAAAGFAKTLIDAFMAMPAEVKGIILALVGLNKLTGGAVGSIVAELGKGLIRGVLGINAGVVNLNAASVTGLGGAGGAVGTATKGGGIRAAAGGIAKVFVAGMAVAAAGVLAEQLMAQSAQIRQMGEDLKTQAGNWVKSDTTSRQQIVDAIERIDEQMSNPLNALALEVTNGLNGGKDALLATRADLSNRLAVLDGRGTALQRTFGTVGSRIEGGLADAEGAVWAVSRGVGTVYAAQQAVRQATAAAGSRLSQAVNGTTAAVRTDTAVLRAKNMSPRVNVTLYNSFSVRSYMNGKVVVDAYTGRKRA